MFKNILWVFLNKYLLKTQHFFKKKKVITFHINESGASKNVDILKIIRYIPFDLDKCF